MAAIAKTLIPRNLQEPEPLQPVMLPDSGPQALPAQPRPDVAMAPIQVPDAPLQPLPQMAQPKVVEPSPLDRQIQHDQQKLQKIQFQQDNPWGTANNHPGVGGKIAHVLSVAGNIAGDIFAPSVMARIPGTQLNRQVEEGETSERLAKEQEQQSESAFRGANTSHLNAETPEIAPNAESNRRYQGAESDKIENDIAQGPSLATAYSHAVNQAIKEGRDPAQDPIVQHLQDAITGLQKQAAPKGGEHVSLMDPKTGKPFAGTYDPTEKKYYDAAGKEVLNAVPYERPMSINLTSPGDSGDMVRAIGEYRMAPPSARTAQGAALLRQVAAQFPGYDASQYEAQVANRKYFTSGKGGLVINALNTVAKHLDDAEKNMPNNSSIPLFNKGKNLALSAIGEAPTKKWDIDADAIGGEWSKLVSGGVATEGELNHIKGLLNNADSPKAMAQAIAEIRELTNGKLAGIQQQIGSGQLEVPSRGISSVPSGGAETREYQGHMYEKGADGQWHLQQK
jgi:hypothetical protein